jgi:hypothetical protein
MECHRQTARGAVTTNLNFTLNLAQLVMLGGLVWALARMSKSVDVLTTVSDKLVLGLEKIEIAMAGLVTRVTVLEDRGGRRSTDRLP